MKPRLLQIRQTCVPSFLIFGKLVLFKTKHLIKNPKKLSKNFTLNLGTVFVACILYIVFDKNHHHEPVANDQNQTVNNGELHDRLRVQNNRGQSLESERKKLTQAGAGIVKLRLEVIESLIPPKRRFTLETDPLFANSIKLLKTARICESCPPPAPCS